MSIRAGTPALIDELIKLLGLEGKHVRKLSLIAEVHQPTFIEVEMLMDEDAAGQHLMSTVTKTYQITEL